MLGVVELVEALASMLVIYWIASILVNVLRAARASSERPRAGGSAQVAADEIAAITRRANAEIRRLAVEATARNEDRL